MIYAVTAVVCLAAGVFLGYAWGHREGWLVGYNNGVTDTIKSYDHTRLK